MDRFHYVQDCILDGSTDHLMIDKIRDRMEDVKYGYELHQEIQKQLEQFRDIAMNRYHEKNRENK